MGVDRGGGGSSEITDRLRYAQLSDRRAGPEYITNGWKTMSCSATNPTERIKEAQVSWYRSVTGPIHTRPRHTSCSKQL